MNNMIGHRAGEYGGRMGGTDIHRYQLYILVMVIKKNECKNGNLRMKRRKSEAKKKVF